MKSRIVLILFVLVLFASIAVSAFAGGTGTPNPSTSRRMSVPSNVQVFLPILTKPKPVPAFSHIYTIMMENEDYASVIGSASAPYINSLAAQYALATNYTGITHPSQPNYIALFSGATNGVIDDELHDITAPNVADQIEGVGRKWMTFAQNYPLGCYTGMLASGGVDGPGNYVRRHVPAMSFTSINQNPVRCANITDFAHFDPAAADYEFIVPNLCNDMHDCSVAMGDAFLASFVPRILASPAWQNGGVLFIVWDEDLSTVYTPNVSPVAALVIANNVTAGYRSSTPFTHYSLLRTIQNAWHMGCLANSCASNDMAEFFK